MVSSCTNLQEGVGSILREGERSGCGLLLCTGKQCVICLNEKSSTCFKKGIYAPIRLSTYVFPSFAV